MMNQAQDFFRLAQNQYDQAMRLSSLLLANTERVTSMQLELSRKMLNDNAETLKTLSGIKDVKSLSEAHSNAVQSHIDKAFATAREIYDMALANQTELEQFIEEQLVDMNKSVIGNLDQFAKFVPGCPDEAVNSLKQYVNMSETAFKNASETARKMRTQYAEASMKTASTVKAAAKKMDPATN